MKRLIFAVAIFTMTFISCNTKTKEHAAEPADAAPLNLSYYVVNSFPQDPSLFTEGFLFHNSALYESTGSPEEFPNTRSLIGIVDLKTGKLDEKLELDRSKFFGEGIVILNDKLYQLTYKNRLGFVYDLKTFKKISEFKYANLEGWGLTTDGKSLIMSDGTDKLTYLNPETQKLEKTLAITDNGVAVINLNELELITGYLYANIWKTDTIVKIDPSSGNVVGKIDLSQLTLQQKAENATAQELNGIAYDAVSNRIFVTGKMWSKIYQIEFKQ
jgi:glutamine cyclotransferase